MTFMRHNRWYMLGGLGLFLVIEIAAQLAGVK